MLKKERFYNDIASDINVIEPSYDDREDNVVILGQLELNIQELLYVEAMQNYAMIFLADGSSQIVRSTLKFLESTLSPYHIIRTHRSYLVNLKNVKMVSGNAQGLKLSLQGTDTIVPVSRSYIASVKARLWPLSTPG